MAPVLREFEQNEIEYRLLFTGQHFVTMQDLLVDFRVATKPTELTTPSESDSLNRIIPWFFRALWRISVSRRALLRSPLGGRGLVIIHGDTLSTLIGAIGGRLNRCRVAHVESGLRSFSLREPFPEELTRILVFRLSNIAFCPGEWAAANMQKYRAEIVDTGNNTLLDAVRYALDNNTDPTARDISEPYCVVSIHRFENLASEERFRHIVETIVSISRRLKVEVVLHPATRRRIERSESGKLLRSDVNINLRDRMKYTSFIRLLSGARLVLTDGGSNQEELHYLSVPTLLARKRSERLEGLGTNAELLSSGKSSDWEQVLKKIESRLRGLRPELEGQSPSRLICKWLIVNQ